MSLETWMLQRTDRGLPPIAPYGVYTMKLSIAVLLILLLTGCHWGNIRDFERKNMSASGANFLGWGQYNYYKLSIINTPVGKSHLNLILELPCGTKMELAQITPENIKKLTGISVLKIKDNIDQYALPCGKNLNNGPIYFYFEDARLTEIVIWINYPSAMKEEAGIRIGRAGEEMYQFPLSEWQLRKIFGEPDNMRTFWLMP